VNPPPVIVHAAADLRREALLAETARDRQTAPPRTTTRDRWHLAIVRGTVARVAALASRIVDEFEPIPDSASLSEGRTESRL
jgi:hypothetical protein